MDYDNYYHNQFKEHMVLNLEHYQLLIEPITNKYMEQLENCNSVYYTDITTQYYETIKSVILQELTISLDIPVDCAIIYLDEVFDVFL